MDLFVQICVYKSGVCFGFVLGSLGEGGKRKKITCEVFHE